MNLNHQTILGLTLLFPLVAGCASRTAPFNELDEAQVKVLRLQGQEPPPVPPAVQPGVPGAPQLIPGVPLPPELQAMGQQVAQGLNQALPGIIPPGLIPGATPTAPAVPVAPPPPRFKGYIMLQERFLASDGPDKSVKDEILDIFGDEDSFQDQRDPCFFPGMGFSFSRSNGPPVELLISISCKQAQGDGFTWPYSKSGFTPDTQQRLTKIYQQLWGPVPSGA